MLLLDAVYTNVGGTKVLLDYFVYELEKLDLEVFYLFDDRIRNNHPIIKSSNKILYLNGGLFSRHKFYLNNRKNFEVIFCFSNIPPTVKLKGCVYTYFQQQLFINVPDTFTSYMKFLYFFKSLIIRFSLFHSDQLLVQSDSIKKSFIRKYKIDENKVKVMPFYPEFKNKYNKNIVKDPNSYIYVSNGNAHKNHIRLITAFCSFFDSYKLGKLILTINNNYPDVLKFITIMQQRNYPIENLGFLEREELQKYYNKCQYVIFPSFAESFGLGLIEGVNNGCKIISADLPYTYEVCIPSLVFNPYDTYSIVNAFVKSAESDLSDSFPIIENKINELLSILVKIKK